MKKQKKSRFEADDHYKFNGKDCFTPNYQTQTNWLGSNEIFFTQGGVAKCPAMGTCISKRFLAKHEDNLLITLSWSALHSLHYQAEDQSLYFWENWNFNNVVQTQWAAVCDHRSSTEASRLCFQGSTVVLRTEASYLESLTFWPEWSTEQDLRVILNWAFPRWKHRFYFNQCP